MYLVIRELHGISKTCYCVTKDAHLNNCSKQHICTEIFYKLFYSLTVESLFKNSSTEASGLLFIFVCVSTGYAHFSNKEIRISCEPDRPTSVFFSCETAVNIARKAWFEVCGESLHRFSTQKKKFAFKQMLTCV